MASVGLVDAHGDVAGGAGDAAVFDVRHGRAGHCRGQAVRLAHRLRLLFVDAVGHLQGLHLIKDELGLRVECHLPPPRVRER